MQDIIEKLKSLDGITSKAAEKILFDLIINKSKLDNVNELINQIRHDYSICEICFFYKYKNKCKFCDESNRKKTLICVVSKMTDAYRILNSEFKGLIHVLGGEINVQKGITPNKLKIDELIKRIHDNIEIIMGLNYTFEGEVTFNFIVNKINNKKVKVTRFARGISSGSVINYIDEDTLNNAIKNRK
ncbi:toprim domain-containing protein [Spiroplasma endosymbiont of Crioceris asparagi]|uniref:toprim domain-containing protein n=1 Tax=Spiroplasma endosymbiont of Crioceris asparagi TaxID=3066286 RepID=UPI0030D30243